MEPLQDQPGDSPLPLIGEGAEVPERWSWAFALGAFMLLWIVFAAGLALPFLVLPAVLSADYGPSGSSGLPAEAGLAGWIVGIAGILATVVVGAIVAGDAEVPKDGPKGPVDPREGEGLGGRDLEFDPSGGLRAEP